MGGLLKGKHSSQEAESFSIFSRFPMAITTKHNSRNTHTHSPPRLLFERRPPDKQTPNSFRFLCVDQCWEMVIKLNVKELNGNKYLLRLYVKTTLSGWQPLLTHWNRRSTVGPQWEILPSSLFWHTQIWLPVGYNLLSFFFRFSKTSLHPSGEPKKH
jgi:hypothetical protein